MGGAFAILQSLSNSSNFHDLPKMIQYGYSNVRKISRHPQMCPTSSHGLCIGQDLRAPWLEPLPLLVVPLLPKSVHRHKDLVNLLDGEGSTEHLSLTCISGNWIAHPTQQQAYFFLLYSSAVNVAGAALVAIQVHLSTLAELLLAFYVTIWHTSYR